MQRYEIHLFTDDCRFLLQDDDAASLPVGVDTLGAGEIAVVVEIHEERPDLGAAGGYPVDSANLKIDSGRLVVASSTEYFPEAFRIPMRRGAYEAIVCEDDDRYLVALYPAAAAERSPAPSMRVAPLAPSHLSEYRELMLRGYAESPDAFTSTAEERAREPDSWWLQRIADPTGLSAAFGCFDGETLAGTVTVEFSSKPKTRHKAHLIGMFVAPEARGRGAAHLLLEAALDHCKSRGGIASVTLTVTEGNEPAIALYRAAGFRSFGLEPIAILTPEGYRAKVHMQLTLGDPA